MKFVSESLRTLDEKECEILNGGVLVAITGNSIVTNNLEEMGMHFARIIMYYILWPTDENGDRLPIDMTY